MPATPAFRGQAQATKIHAYLMSLIDGERSIEDIATVLEQQRLMPKNEAIPVIVGFMEKMQTEAAGTPGL